jgi:hypothetical protein
MLILERKGGRVVDLLESDIIHSSPSQVLNLFSFKWISRMNTTDEIGSVRRKQLCSCLSRQFGVSKPQ